LEHVRSPLVFLLALNLFLIGMGALVDIFSAILVAVLVITYAPALTLRAKPASIP